LDEWYLTFDYLVLDEPMLEMEKIGLLTKDRDDYSFKSAFKKEYSKQFYFAIASGIVATVILLTDSKFFTATANLAYAAGILLILATFVVGKEVGGSKSWIPLGFMNIQPVEVCKIFTSLALAKYQPPFPPFQIL